MADVQFDPCLCDWIAEIGEFKDPLVGMLDTSIAALTAIKVALSLAPANVTDQLKKLRYEAELAALEQAVGQLETPIALISSLGAPFADCDPVSNVTTITKRLRDILLSDLDDRRFKVESFIEGLDAEGLKVERLDKLIDMLNEVKSAIDDCGNV